MYLKKFKDGIILSVKVKPNSLKFSIELNDRVTIHCKSPPKQGKANIEIIKQLKRIFSRDVTIVSGLKSKNKNIFIPRITEKEFKKLFSKQNITR